MLNRERTVLPYRETAVLRFRDRNRRHQPVPGGLGPRTARERARAPGPGHPVLDSPTAVGVSERASASSPGAERPPAATGLAEVRIIAAHPDTAQLVAQVLRRYFSGDEPRSYPAGEDGSGTLLHFTVDTGFRGDTGTDEPPADTAGPWLTSSGTHARRSHEDEPG
ncbi:hypothetical protein [Streptomyces sp. NPDC058371]|uniref:hypothetical protein n=1 Tax=Streptomyces sp. NPDC058371 TaxID=3346463 RepID=UPI003651BFEB